MADRTLTCLRCDQPFAHSAPGRPPTACPDCRTHCAVEGCDRPHQTAGFCHPHYERWRHGDELPALIEHREQGERICKHPGCDRKRGNSATYCVMHQNRVKFFGDPGQVDPLIAPPGHPVWSTPENRRRESRLRKYGLTPEQFDELLAAQGGRCKICGTDNPVRGTRVETWCVDHDHACCPGKTSCGKCVRGLLCSHCNRGLGFFGDSLTIIESAAAYLRHYTKVSEPAR